MESKECVYNQDLMFKGQFKLTKGEQKVIADICLFTVMLYIKAWFQHRMDHLLLDLKDIRNYKVHNSAIAGNAIEIFLVICLITTRNWWHSHALMMVFQLLRRVE